MAIHLKIFFLTCLLSLMVLMEEVKPVMAKGGKKGGLKKRVKILEEVVSELEEKMKELEECSGKYTHHLF